MASELTRYANKMILVIICASIVMILGGVVFLRAMYALEFALGVVMACGLNIAKVLMLKYAVTRATSMDSGGMGFTSIMYLVRFVLTGLVLVAAHFIPFVELLGTVFGLLAMPIASYVLKFFIKDDGTSPGPVDDTVDVIDEDTVE